VLLSSYPVVTLARVDVRDAVQRGVAEALGAGALVFIGAGAIVQIGFSGDGNLLAVATAHGLILAIFVSALGHISGAHFNPAVTFGFLVTKRIDGAMAIVYWISQFAGAVVAALLLRIVFDDRAVDATHLGAPAVGQGVAVWEAFVIEIVMTFLLVLVVFATAVDERGAFKLVAGFAIGLTIFADILVGGTISGAAMNPARAFGPELVGNYWADAWIYYIACPIGGALAALLYVHLYLRPGEVVTVGEAGTQLEEDQAPRPEV
jgi:aquaporin Z